MYMVRCFYDKCRMRVRGDRTIVYSGRQFCSVKCCADWKVSEREKENRVQVRFRPQTIFFARVL